MNGIGDYSMQVVAIAETQLRKLWHDPMELLMRAIQPLLWLLLFGNVIGHVPGLTGSGIPYIDFLAPGILAQSVLVIAILDGVSVIWDRDLGVLQRYLVSPAPRSALVLGKALTSAVRGLFQAAVVYLVSLMIGVTLCLEPLYLVGTILLIVLGAGVFATFSLVIACIVRTRERFMGISQLLIMPVLFASNAIYPLDLMPHWLQVVAHLNPLTYFVDALRGLMLQNSSALIGIKSDFLVLISLLSGFVAVAAHLYPRMGR